MDNPDDMKRVLETLRLETLQDISPTRLSEAIKENLPANVDKRHILDIYIMWFHPRLKGIDVSAKGYLGLEVFHLYHFLKALPGDDSHLADAFYDWLRCNAVGNSVISTKLRIAEAEFRRLAPAMQKTSERSTDASMSEDHFGQMHPDRAKLSRETRIVIELDEGKDDDDIIFVSSNPMRGDRGSGKGNGSDGRPGLPFLTGSNMLPVAGSKKPPVVGSNKLPVGGKAKVIQNMNSKGPGPSKLQGKPVSKPKPTPGPKSATSATPPQSKIPDGPQKLHKEYVCSRCEMKGDHVFKDCPILDPSFDKKLPKGYICRLCRKKSDHHVSVCPFNMDPESMTQRRLVSVKQNRHPSDERRGGPRESQTVEARNRSRSPPRKINKHLSKGALGLFEGIVSAAQSYAQRQPREPKAAPPPPASPRNGAPALEMGEIRETGEIKGDMMVSPSLEAKGPFKRRLVSYADEVEKTYGGNSRVNDHQLLERLSLKTGKRARDKRRLVRKRLMSYADEVGETHDGDSRADSHRLFEKCLFSYDDETDERHENNSRVNDQRKRKASPSPSLPTPWEDTPTMEMEMGEIREIKETIGNLPNLKVNDTFKRRRVSCDDEAEESNSRVNDQPSELAVLELIRVESVKTDLLQLDPPSNPFSAFSLRGQESLCQVNTTVSEPRPRASDFYDLCDDDEQLVESIETDELPVESIETEMAAGTEAARDHERAPVLAQGMTELTMALSGRGNSAAVRDEDTVMADHEPETAVVVSTYVLRPAKLTTGSFQSEQSPTSGARMEGSEAGVFIQPANDGLCSPQSAVREGVSTTMTEESDEVVETGVFPDQFVAPEVIDAKEAESLSPRPVNKLVMEVDVTTTTAEKLSATFGEPENVVASPSADTEMADGQLPFDVEEPAVACDFDM